MTTRHVAQAANIIKHHEATSTKLNDLRIAFMASLLRLDSGRDHEESVRLKAEARMDAKVVVRCGMCQFEIVPARITLRATPDTAAPR